MFPRLNAGFGGPPHRLFLYACCPTQPSKVLPLVPFTHPFLGNHFLHFAEMPAIPHLRLRDDIHPRMLRIFGRTRRVLQWCLIYQVKRLLAIRGTVIQQSVWFLSELSKFQTSFKSSLLLLLLDSFSSKIKLDIKQIYQALNKLVPALWHCGSVTLYLEERVDSEFQGLIFNFKLEIRGIKVV